MSIYEKTNVARALLYWAKNNNGNDCYYLEDRMYAVADGDMVIILIADSYDEAKRKAKARTKQGKWRDYSDEGYVECPFCGSATNCEDNKDELHYCWNCGAEMRQEETKDDG